MDRINNIDDLAGFVADYNRAVAEFSRLEERRNELRDLIRAYRTAIRAVATRVGREDKHEWGPR